VAVITPFTFKGKIGRAPYAAWSVTIFLSQYLIPLAAGNLLKSDMWVYLIPHRALRSVGANADLVQALGAAYLLIVAWALGALAFRRANDANVGGWVAVFAITPIIQILTILVLCVAPPVTEREPPAVVADAETSEPVSIWASGVLGVLAGVGLTMVAVAAKLLQ
jgi:uncharacterized membrane protein YhaH (DUF805 family)